MPVEHSTVREIIEAAHQAVTESGVPEPLQAIAFTKAFDYLAGGAPVPPTPPGGGGGDGGGGGGGDGGGGDGGGGSVDQRVAAIAKKMGVDAGKLAYVFELDDEGVSLVVQRSRLANDRSNATREVALLYAAARQAGGYDASHTPSSAIKERANDMGVLDEANYASTLSGKKDWFAMKGKGVSREFRVSQHGYEEAGRLVNRIIGTPGGGT